MQLCGGRPTLRAPFAPALGQTSPALFRLVESAPRPGAQAGFMCRTKVPSLEHKISVGPYGAVKLRPSCRSQALSSPCGFYAVAAVLEAPDCQPSTSGRACGCSSMRTPGWRVRSSATAEAVIEEGRWLDTFILLTITATPRK